MNNLHYFLCGLFLFTEQVIVFISSESIGGLIIFGPLDLLCVNRRNVSWDLFYCKIIKNKCIVILVNYK